LWTPTREFNDTGCVIEDESADNTTKSETVPMSELNFVWKLYEVSKVSFRRLFENQDLFKRNNIIINIYD